MIVLQLYGRKFSHKKLCRRIYSTEIEFYLKKRKKLFESPLGGLGGNISTSSIARWKARGRLPIRHNSTFSPIFYGWDVINRNLSKSAFFKGWVVLSANFRWKGEGVAHQHQPLLVSRKLEWLLFCVVSKYPHCILWFCHKAHVWQTDGRT